MEAISTRWAAPTWLLATATFGAAWNLFGLVQLYGGPLIDGLMAEIGMSGGSLNGLLLGSGAAESAEPGRESKAAAADQGARTNR